MTIGKALWAWLGACPLCSTLVGGARICLIGWAFGLYKVGNSMSYWTDAYTSDVSLPIQVVGPCNSANSTVEVAFLTKDLLYGSSASQILL